MHTVLHDGRLHLVLTEFKQYGGREEEAFSHGFQTAALSLFLPPWSFRTALLLVLFLVTLCYHSKQSRHFPKERKNIPRLTQCSIYLYRCMNFDFVYNFHLLYVQAYFIISYTMCCHKQASINMFFILQICAFLFCSSPEKEVILALSAVNITNLKQLLSAWQCDKCNIA